MKHITVFRISHLSAGRSRQVFPPLHSNSKGRIQVRCLRIQKEKRYQVPISFCLTQRNPTQQLFRLFRNLLHSIADKATMNTHKASFKTYHFHSIVVKEGPHRSPKQFHGDEASVVAESKAIFINNSKWCIKGKEIEKMDVQGSNKLVITTTKGKTYDFQHFQGDDASWQEFKRKLDKVYSRKAGAPKDSFSKFIKGSSKLGLGSPRRQRFAPSKVVTDKKTSPRRPHVVFGRARQRPLIPPSVPWDIEEKTSVHDTEFDDACLNDSPPPSPLKRAVASPQKRPVENRPVDFSDDESEEKEEPVQRNLTRKRRLVIEDESSEDEEEMRLDLPMTTPQANRVVSPRLSTRSVSPQRPSDEIDKNQTTLSGFFKVAQKNVENSQMSSVKRELELTPRKSSVKLVSTPTRVGKSSTGSSHRRSLQQKGWLSPGNNASRGRTMERFGILSAGANEDESDSKPKDQANSRSYSANFGSSSATFTFNKDSDREKFEKYETGQGTPKMPMAFSSPSRPTHSPLRSRLSFKKVSRSPVSKHAINDLTKSQPEPDLRFNQYSGLRNLGNTCYMNACLQMICTLPDLIKSLHNRGGALTKSLTIVAEKLQEDPVRAVDPHAVKEAMDAKTDKFLGYEQRDAHEFLSDLIDSIHEEVQSEKSMPVKAPHSETSPMDNFLLTVRVCLTCASCGYSRYAQIMIQLSFWLFNS